MKKKNSSRSMVSLWYTGSERISDCILIVMNSKRLDCVSQRIDALSIICLYGKSDLNTR